jgi:hypothetical protein
MLTHRGRQRLEPSETSDMRKNPNRSSRHENVTRRKVDPVDLLVMQVAGEKRDDRSRADMIHRNPRPSSAIAEANLSPTMQWLNRTCTVGLNTRHQRSGHHCQGRYTSLLIGEEAEVQDVVRSVHLNSVRLGALKLGEPDRAAKAARRSGLRISWASVVQVVEKEKGERWASDGGRR